MKKGNLGFFTYLFIFNEEGFYKFISYRRTPKDLEVKNASDKD